MHSTKNTLDAATRGKSIVLLDMGLIYAMDLDRHAKRAPWNIRGPILKALHEHFDDVAQQARMRRIWSPSTSPATARRSKLEEQEPPTQPYIFSLAVGLLIGVIYALLDVRSPAPPAIALVGLLGILVGEPIPLLIKQTLKVQKTWMDDQVKPHMFGQWT